MKNLRDFFTCILLLQNRTPSVKHSFSTSYAASPIAYHLITHILTHRIDLRNQLPIFAAVNEFEVRSKKYRHNHQRQNRCRH